MSNESDRLYWVALASAGGIGGKTITRLLRHFGSLAEVFGASSDSLCRVPGIGARTAAVIQHIDLPAVEAELAGWSADGLLVLTWADAAYPPNLMRAPHAPPVLFVRGDVLPGDSRAVAIIGTRQPAPQNAALARQMACELAARGWVIVSGLAIGLDTAAHRGALDGGGRTLAVLGSGVQHIYPRRNTKLAEAITEHGAVLSDLHPQAAVSRQSLIARNRITSGLSTAVIVVQSNADSGSVNTAKRAWKQGRAVFAVTGELAGNEALLANGAEPLDPASGDWDALSNRLAAVEIKTPPGGDGSEQMRLF